MAKLFSKDPTKQRVLELAPVAKEIIKVITDADLELGNNESKKNFAEHDAIAKEILKIMVDNKVKYVDKEFLFQLVLQPFDQIKEIVLVSLKKSLDLGIDKALGKGFRDMTLEDLDKIMRG